VADNTGKTVAAVGIGAALLGMLAALGSGKKKTADLQGVRKSGCNCGR